MTRTLVAACALSALVASGCASDERPAPTSEISLTEFAVTSTASRLQSGSVGLQVDNVGRFPHTLVITSEAGDVVTATDLIPPGETLDLAIELDPGTYSFTCRIVAVDDSGNLIDHFEQGMVTRLEVSA